MPKLNYFDLLERLAVLCTRAVFIVCSPQKPSAQSELTLLRASADKNVCELEKALFADFMPPLERKSIAECAHAALRVIERCNEISNYRSCKNFLAEKKNKEAELCIRLAQLIEEDIFRLKRIKKPRELPDLVGFRKLLGEARVAHLCLQKKLSTGMYPKSSQQHLCLIGQLRCELSDCFDRLVEVMLDNI